MRSKIIAASFWILVLAAFVACFASGRFAETRAYAQSPGQIELACPAGYGPVSIIGQTLDGATGKWRQIICSDAVGHLFMQPDSVAGAIPGFTGIFTPGHVVAVSSASPPVFQDGGPAPGVLSQVSAATNFGANLSAQTVIASVTTTGNIFVDMHTVVSAIGVGCGSGTSSVLPTLNFTAPGGTAESIAFTSSVSVSGNGILDTGSSFVSGLTPPQHVTIVAKVGTAVTYTTTSTLGPTGCSPTPQYTMYVKAVF